LPVGTDSIFVTIIIILAVMGDTVVLVISIFSSGTSRRSPLFLYTSKTCSGRYLPRRALDILEFGRVSSRAVLTISTSMRMIGLLDTGSTLAATNDRIKYGRPGAISLTGIIAMGSLLYQIPIPEPKKVDVSNLQPTALERSSDS
jgi:hypothetical protein